MQPKNQTNGQDVKKLEKLLSKNLISFASRFDKKDEDIYGWEFTQGNANIEGGKATQINIAFLGTGSMPYFNENKLVSGSGDSMCQIALQKALYDTSPSAIIKGIGTTKLDDGQYPLNTLSESNPEYAGKIQDVLLGSGLRKRLQIAMEEYLLPTLIKMILSYDLSEEGYKTIDLNVQGHSRGGITGFYFINCVNQLIERIKQGESHFDLDALAAVCKVQKEALSHALSLIQKEKIQLKIHSLSFDPVEGQCREAEVNEWFSNDTTMDVPVIGVQKPLSPNCSTLPAIVERAQFHFAKSERRWAFRATLPTPAQNTQVDYRIQPGTHSTMVGNLGNANGHGQDAYKSIREIPFVKEAALASIDKVKLEAIEFLFKDKLPPFERHIFRKIFTGNLDNNALVYPETRKFLVQHIEKRLSEDMNFQNYAARRVKKLILQENLPLNENLLNDNLYMAYTKWIMKNDPAITKKAYFVLKNEIQNNYLSPKAECKKKALVEWKKETAKDTSYIQGVVSGVKYFKLGTQSEKESREIFLRNSNNQLNLKNLATILPEYTLPFSASHIANEQDAESQYQPFVDPFHVSLSEWLRLENDADSKTMHLELDLLFSSLNAIAIQSTHNEKNNHWVKSEIKKCALDFLVFLQETSLSEEKKIQAIQILFQTLDHYNVDEPQAIRELLLDSVGLTENRKYILEAQERFLSEHAKHGLKQYLSNLQHGINELLENAEITAITAKQLNNRLQGFKNDCDSMAYSDFVTNVNEELKKIQTKEKSAVFTHALQLFLATNKRSELEKWALNAQNNLQSLVRKEQVYQLKNALTPENMEICLFGDTTTPCSATAKSFSISKVTPVLLFSKMIAKKIVAKQYEKLSAFTESLQSKPVVNLLTEEVAYLLCPNNKRRKLNPYYTYK